MIWYMDFGAFGSYLWEDTALCRRVLFGAGIVSGFDIRSSDDISHLCYQCTQECW